MKNLASQQNCGNENGTSPGAGSEVDFNAKHLSDAVRRRHGAALNPANPALGAVTITFAMRKFMGFCPYFFARNDRNTNVTMPLHSCRPV